MMSRFNSANAAYGESYLLITILAAVLGGVDPFGGFGRVMGLVLALIILQVISSGLNLLGLSAHLTLAIWGAILILVMAVGYLTCGSAAGRDSVPTTSRRRSISGITATPRRRRQPGPAASRTASRADLSCADRESRDGEASHH